MKETLTVDVISDVVCPWCYIGQKRLDQAIALTPDIEVQVRWRPYQLDATILAAVKRRTEVSQAIGKVRMASGGTRLVHSREMKVIERYSELGPDGKDLAMLLLRMGRGRLGH